MCCLLIVLTLRKLARLDLNFSLLHRAMQKRTCVLQFGKMAGYGLTNREHFRYTSKIYFVVKKNHFFFPLKDINLWSHNHFAYQVKQKRNLRVKFFVNFRSNIALTPVFFTFTQISQGLVPIAALSALNLRSADLLTGAELS